MDTGYIITISVTVILGILTLYLTAKLSRKKEPVWAYKSTEIIGRDANTPSELKIYFKDKPVESVWRTTLIFFNRGMKAIEEGDYRRSPIIFSFDGGEILTKPEVLERSKQDINFIVQRTPKRNKQDIRLVFPFLNHNDGLVLEVLHTPIKQIVPRINLKDVNRVVYSGEFITPIRKGYLQKLIKNTIGILLVVALFGFVIFQTATSESIDIGMIVIFSSMILAISFMGLRQLYLDRRFPRWSWTKE